jgi:hypothetical protein
VFFQRKAVIKAETEIASREFDKPFVGLEQALGWVAYRNEKNFRSLSRADLAGKTYCGQRYEPDFGSSQPEKELFEFLVEGKIKGYRSGVELTLAERMKMTSVRDEIGVTFFRNDLKEVWPLEVSETLWPADAQAVAQVGSSDSPSGSGDPALVATSPTARPKKQRGPRPVKFNSTKAAMQRDIREGTQTLEKLQNMTEKQLTKTYEVSRETARKALTALAAEKFGNSKGDN